MKNIKYSPCALIALLFLLLVQSNFVCAQEKRADISELMPLPYLQGYYPPPEEVNVTKYNRQSAFKGYNLYSSCHDNYAALIDMKGNVLHEWSYDVSQIWPDDEKVERTCWENVYLYENGDLLGVNAHHGIVKIDKDSNLLWSYKCNCHHDIDVDEKGNIYTLTEENIQLTEERAILDNSILILSPEGKFMQRLSLLKLMKESQNAAVKPFFDRVVGIALAGGDDAYHSNTIEVFDGKVAHQSPILYQKGNILICMLTISTVAIINPQHQDIVWISGPGLWLEGQHYPTLLDNGNMLIFDNHYIKNRTQSRVLEFNPLTKEIVWEYIDDNFYSDTHGINERLPNGNTLITESDKGRAFEVTKEKEIVWEFVNPYRTRGKDELIATLLSMIRVDPAYVESWLPKK